MVRETGEIVNVCVVRGQLRELTLSLAQCAPEPYNVRCRLH